MLTYSRAIVLFFSVVIFLNLCVNGCDIWLVSQPRGFNQVPRNAEYTGVCVFETTCRQVRYSFVVDRGGGNPGYYDIDSHHSRIYHGCTYSTSVAVKDIRYTVSMKISAFEHNYSGKYKCILMELNNSGNMVKSRLFSVSEIELSPFSLYSNCFFPDIQNISAYVNKSNHDISVRWHPEIKEDPNLHTCFGARTWRVRLLTFPTIQDAPDDFEVVKTSPVDWISIPNGDTSYIFTNVLRFNEYYSIQVVHEGNFSVTEKTVFKLKPIIYASHIYYFGPQSPAKVQKLSYNTVSLSVGASTSVHCEVTGLPMPEVKWISGNGKAPTVRVNNSAVLDLSRVSLEDSGTYYCIANNIVVNPPEGKREESDTRKLTVDVKDALIIDGLSCRSLPMESSVCKLYIHTSLKIFTIDSANETEIEREDRAKSLIIKINFFIGFGTCRKLAYSMMCHNVYPYCDILPNKPTPRKLCKSVCEEFLTGRCKGYLEEDDLLYSILVTGCDNRQYTAGDSPECIPLSYNTYENDQVELIEDTGDCYRNDGRGYSGNEYLTKSGALCQSWSFQSPHPHPMLPDLYRSDLEQAFLSCRNPGGIGSKPWCYTNDPEKRWEYCDIPKCDSCELYTGDLCANLDDYKETTVLVRRDRAHQSQANIEEVVSNYFNFYFRLQRVTEGCKNILRMLLCYRAFPKCTESSTELLCSEYCRFNQTLKYLCPSMFETLAQFVLYNGQFLSSPSCHLVESIDSQCVDIPQMSVATANLIDQSSVTYDCYDGTGLYYNGTVSVTEKGVTCQYWDSQEPHSHAITSERYPELVNSENYCRNPDNLLERPWCFTTDSETVWDYCDIESSCVMSCVPSPTTSSITNTSISMSTFEESPKFIYPLIGSIIVLVVIFVMVFVICVVFTIRYKYKKKSAAKTSVDITHMKFSINQEYQTTNIIEDCAIPENLKLLDSQQIRYVSQLGQGNFGIVFKGKAFGLKEEVTEEDEGIDVAVKTLKEEATSEVKQDFIDEAKLMFTFDHPNILKIHGVCMNEMPYQLVFEYMDEGDLTKFLRSRASSQQRRLINPFSYRSRTESCYSDDPASLSKTELLYICKQIAAGMSYLSDNKHVHRDLACRNCLIKSDLVVKIGDFGMSRNLYSKDYYRINGKAVLPVRWMSPEALIYGKFSIKGDVWSFGVVMWEVFSFALQPYYGISNAEVTEAIRKGKTLNCPDNCPSDIYRLMKECWSTNPLDRVPFIELHDRLSRLHHSASRHDDSPSLEHATSTDDSFEDDVFVASNSPPTAKVCVTLSLDAEIDC